MPEPSPRPTRLRGRRLPGAGGGCAGRGAPLGFVDLFSHQDSSTSTRCATRRIMPWSCGRSLTLDRLADATETERLEGCELSLVGAVARLDLADLDGAHEPESSLSAEASGAACSGALSAAAGSSGAEASGAESAGAGAAAAGAAGASGAAAASGGAAASAASGASGAAAAAGSEGVDSAGAASTGAGTAGAADASGAGESAGAASPSTVAPALRFGSRPRTLSTLMPAQLGNLVGSAQRHAGPPSSP